MVWSSEQEIDVLEELELAGEREIELVEIEETGELAVIGETEVAVEIVVEDVEIEDIEETLLVLLAEYPLLLLTVLPPLLLSPNTLLHRIAQFAYVSSAPSTPKQIQRQDSKGQGLEKRSDPGSFLSVSITGV